MGHLFDLRRRSFLLSSLAVPFFGRLRAQTALDATLLKTNAGLDDFITEKYHDQIAAILSAWRASLVQSVEKVLAPDFRGASPQPSESRTVRPGPALEVRLVTFPQQPALEREAFLREL